MFWWELNPLCNCFLDVFYLSLFSINNWSRPQSVRLGVMCNICMYTYNHSAKDSGIQWFKNRLFDEIHSFCRYMVEIEGNVAMPQNHIGTGRMLFVSTSAPPGSGTLRHTHMEIDMYKGESFYSYIWRFQLRHDSRCHGNHQENMCHRVNRHHFERHEKQKQ